MRALEQRMSALSGANEVRMERARIGQQLAAAPSSYRARQMCARLVERPPRAIERMEAWTLLSRCRGVGPAKWRRMLRHAGVSEMSFVGDLTDRQRRALAMELRRPTFQEQRRGVAA